jgi:lysophospholipase L1-like esterase
MTDPRTQARVVTLADSLALPRIKEGEVLRWEETWPYRLERLLVAKGIDAEVINSGLRSRTSEMLELDELRFKHPTVIVIQIGVVDCAPRIFSQREKLLLNLPVVPKPLRDLIIGRRSRRRKEITGRDPLASVYTRPEQYAKNVASLFREVETFGWPITMLALAVLSNPEAMEKKSPGHSANVSLYNALLERACTEAGVRYLSREELIPDPRAQDVFSKDGYHLAVEGSRIVAESVAQVLAPMIAAPSERLVDVSERSKRIA